MSTTLHPKLPIQRAIVHSLRASDDTKGTCHSLGLPAGCPMQMHWYHNIAWFFGGAFLANAIPHFVSGVTGHPFQSPFATPPGEGLSPAWVNVLWGSANFIFAYLLLVKIGNFEFRRWHHVMVAGAGGLAMALMLAHAFGRFYGGQ